MIEIFDPLLVACYRCFVSIRLPCAFFFYFSFNFSSSVINLTVIFCLGLNLQMEKILDVGGKALIAKLFADKIMQGYENLFEKLKYKEEE